MDANGCAVMEGALLKAGSGTWSELLNFQKI
jgi:hypothetical protein